MPGPTWRGGSIAHPRFDHIGGVNEMILDPLAAVEEGRVGLLDNLLEGPVVRVSKHGSEVTARPELVARVVGAADALERRHVAGGSCLLLREKERSALKVWLTCWPGKATRTVCPISSTKPVRPGLSGVPRP